MRRTVTNGFIPVNLTNLQDSALQADNLAHWVGPARLWIDPKERRAWADKVEVKPSAEKYSRRRGKAGWYVRQTAPGGSKPCPLNLVQRMFRLIRAREMADKGEPSYRAMENVVHKPVEFPHCQAEPSHSRIEM